MQTLMFPVDAVPSIEGPYLEDITSFVLTKSGDVVVRFGSKYPPLRFSRGEKGVVSAQAGFVRSERVKSWRPRNVGMLDIDPHVQLAILNRICGSYFKGKRPCKHKKACS